MNQVLDLRKSKKIQRKAVFKISIKRLIEVISVIFISSIFDNLSN